MAEEKISLKRAELSIQRFNEVAIPHHLGLLKNHKSNIEKNIALGDWEKVKKEEINAMRVVKQLKNLLLEMDIVRNKVRDSDIDKFDDLTSSGRQRAVEGIKDYMDIQLKSPSSTKSEYSYNGFHEDPTEDLPGIQADFQLQGHQLEAKQACLKEFENLHREVQDLHEVFKNCNEMVQVQGEDVNIIAECADEALENIVNGEQNLRRALKYKKAMYPMVGGLVGTCIGGPIGLIAGIKAGALAAIGCGVLGFTGGSVLEKNEIGGTPIQDGIKEE